MMRTDHARALGASVRAAALLPIALGLAWSASAQESVGSTPSSQMPEPIRFTPPFSQEAIKDILEFGHVGPGMVDRGDGTAAVYLFTPPPDATVQIDVRSRTIDSVVEIYEPGGTKPLMEDDDGGDFLDARLVLAPRAYKTPLIIVVRDKKGLGGPFEISTLQIESTTTFDLPRLQFGTPTYGTIDSSSLRIEGLEQPYQIYTFLGKAKQRVVIDAHSDDFDPTLQLRLNNKLIGQDSDSGPGRDARLIRYLKEDGDYSILVAARAGEFGAFRVQVDAAPTPQPEPAPTRIHPSYATNDMLAFKNPVINDRSYALYKLTGSAEETFQATLEARDPSGLGKAPAVSLGVGAITPLGFLISKISSTSSTDQPGVGRTTITFTFNRTGELTLRVMGDLDWLGPYSLTVNEMPPTQPSPTTTEAKP
ncbi:hypothetical protein E5554_14710 [Sphingobium sp. PAMC28499]|uniref:hypothetical protein n=1 Tax=Sphingobium sp. PAMC28499 TaxID=2565554 RepID=UPI00109D9DFB|nr:hypothetical protein [Sphingobium sp. PAMC28499]QCB38964.1 hypothetical protein E5554_14710 [Sphingobium sp. PAMC28499]